MRHLTYGVLVDSDLELDVPAAGSIRDIPDVTIRRLNEPVSGSAITWLDRHTDPRLSVGVVRGAFYLRCADDAEFLLESDGQRLHWYSFDGPSDTLVHLVLDHVLPRALARLGRTVLHGSCVAHDGACVAILGRSGAGKSTLAAALMALGLDVVADDCVAVDRRGHVPLVAPAYPGLRLSDTSIQLARVDGLERRGTVSRYTQKSRFAPTAQSLPAFSRIRLTAVISLQDPDDPVVDAPLPSLTRLAPATAGIELLRHSFLLSGPDERAGQLGQVLSLAPTLPVFSLRYDHSASGLERACIEIGSALGVQLPTVVH